MAKKVGNATGVTAATITNKNIDLDVKLSDPSDYIDYTIKVKNNGTEDYYIKEQQNHLEDIKVFLFGLKAGQNRYFVV